MAQLTFPAIPGYMDLLVANPKLSKLSWLTVVLAGEGGELVGPVTALFQALG